MEGIRALLQKGLKMGRKGSEGLCAPELEWGWGGRKWEFRKVIIAQQEGSLT